MQINFEKPVGDQEGQIGGELVANFGAKAIQTRTEIVARLVEDAVNSRSALRAAVAGINADMLVLLSQMNAGLSEAVGPGAILSPNDLDLFGPAISTVVKLTKTCAQLSQLEYRIIHDEEAARSQAKF